MMFMNSRIALVRCLAECAGSLWGMLRTGFSLQLSEATGSLDEPVDSRQVFDGRLHGDPFGTKDPTSRYGDRSPGYIRGNGLGSLEMSHSDDGTPGLIGNLIQSSGSLPGWFHTLAGRFLVRRRGQCRTGPGYRHTFLAEVPFADWLPFGRGDLAACFS